MPLNSSCHRLAPALSPTWRAVAHGLSNPARTLRPQSGTAARTPPVKPRWLVALCSKASVQRCSFLLRLSPWCVSSYKTTTPRSEASMPKRCTVQMFRHGREAGSTVVAAAAAAAAPLAAAHISVQMHGQAAMRPLTGSSGNGCGPC